MHMYILGEFTGVFKSQVFLNNNFQLCYVGDTYTGIHKWNIWIHMSCVDEAWSLDSELYTTDHVSWTFRHSVTYGYIKLFYGQTNPKFWPEWQAKEKKRISLSCSSNFSASCILSMEDSIHKPLVTLLCAQPCWLCCHIVCRHFHVSINFLVVGIQGIYMLVSGFVKRSKILLQLHNYRKNVRAGSCVVVVVAQWSSIDGSMVEYWWLNLNY